MKSRLLALLVVLFGLGRLAVADPQPSPAPGYAVARGAVRRAIDDLRGDCGKPGADAADCARTLTQVEKSLADADAAQAAGHGDPALDRLRQTAQQVREALARTRRSAPAAVTSRTRDEALAAVRRVKDEALPLLQALRRCCDASPGKPGDRACEHALSEIDALIKRADGLVDEGKPAPALDVLKQAAALTRRSTVDCERLHQKR